MLSVGFVQRLAGAGRSISKSAFPKSDSRDGTQVRHVVELVVGPEVLVQCSCGLVGSAEPQLGPGGDEGELGGDESVDGVDPAIVRPLLVATDLTRGLQELSTSPIVAEYSSRVCPMTIVDCPERLHSPAEEVSIRVFAIYALKPSDPACGRVGA
jgi:hypothetical protein